MCHMVSLRRQSTCVMYLYVWQKWKDHHGFENQNCDTMSATTYSYTDHPTHQSLNWKGNQKRHRSRSSMFLAQVAPVAHQFRSGQLQWWRHSFGQTTPQRCSSVAEMIFTVQLTCSSIAEICFWWSPYQEFVVKCDNILLFKFPLSKPCCTYSSKVTPVRFKLRQAIIHRGPQCCHARHGWVCCHHRYDTHSTERKSTAMRLLLFSPDAYSCLFFVASSNQSV